MELTSSSSGIVSSGSGSTRSEDGYVRRPLSTQRRVKS